MNSVVYFTSIAVLTATAMCPFAQNSSHSIIFCLTQLAPWQETIMATQGGAMVSIQYCLISLYGGDDIILMDIME